MSTIKTTNITHGSNSGTANIVLASDGGVTFASAVGLFSSYAIICDSKAGNVHGGDFTTGAWRTRDLNTEIADPDSIVTISSNQFVLGAGTYLIKWSAPAYDVDRHTSRLYDVTNTTAYDGTAQYSDSANNGMVPSTGFARVTPTGSTTYNIGHACQTTKSSSGFGLNSHIKDDGSYVDSSNETASIYTIVEIYKEA